jgi:hypothetical protein
VEDESGELNIQGTRVKAGQEIVIPVRIQSAPNDIHTVSFEVIYDPNSLKFLEDFDDGDLAGSSSRFEINPSAPGRIIVRGSTSEAGIPKGASGNLVWLKFETTGGQSAGQSYYFLRLENLEGDLASFSKTGGILNVYRCNGDLDGDGFITIEDVRIAFNCYLGNGPCPDSDCADVDQDGNITPYDARCLLYKYLDKPSCLDK